MTVETEVANLTTAVDNLTIAVNVSKATLDASVSDSEDARDQSQDARDTANLHKLAAEAAATSATATASALTGFDLDAIAASKAVTAVDVFVYDTSNDSDGGAWRKRTQHTSWYNETLSTATRGSRREFPAVAVIVAEANKLTIYDGDDPTLPMWMVFNQSLNGALSFDQSNGSTSAISSCGFLNGVMAVGQGGSGNGQGVRAITFLDESIDRTSDSVRGATWRYLGNISQRNSGLGGYSYSSKALVSLTVNDVAMTVLPDAPIDPATGLPVPTIAVATAGGVSVIKDDGTVVDITGFSEGTLAYITFDDANNIVTEGEFHSKISAYPIPASDASDSTRLYQYGSKKFPESSVPAFLGAGGSDVHASIQTSAGLAIKSSSSEAGFGGLSRLLPNTVTPAKGMVAYTTSTYNTGWMPGDIKGAFLSDTDDTDLVASGELVTNGTFDSDISGWTAGNSATLSLSSNALKVEYNGVANPFAYQVITTVIGKTYVLSFSVAGLTAGEDLRVIAGEEPTDITPSSALITATGNYSLTFTATTTTTYVKLQALVDASTEFATFDNISVKLADADRSVNNNGLIVNGTVTRSPVATGADLVAYSGFSASNYLEQPYNSDLDFGTGDFSIMGWINEAANSTVETILERDSDTTAQRFTLAVNASGFLTFTCDDDTTVRTATSTIAIDNSTWTHFVATYDGAGGLRIYLNGSLNDTETGAALLTLNNASAVLRVGLAVDGAEPLTNGSLALLRISATVPSDSQIAKIYNDEKFLFQDGAQATLYGASDAVTALAHDPVTDLLHVGTSAGRSVFSGLRRVSNTTTAVGTAISASNNLIAEE